MKRIIFTLLLFSPFIFVHAQEAIRGEIIIEFQNKPSTFSLSATVSTVNTYWDANRINSDHNLSTDYPGGTKTFSSANYDYYIGIDYCYDYDGAPFIVGVGLYKIEINYDGNSSYIYVDLRTSDFFECTTGPDMDFDYDMNNYEFKQAGGTQSINGTTQTFWDYHSKDCSLVTTELEPYPPYNFQLSSSGGNPHLTWDHSTNTVDWWTGYKIYREIRSVGLPNFTESDLIATVSASTTEYTDEAYETGSGWTGYYCLKAINGTRGSEFTDYLDIGIDAFQKYSYNTITTDAEYFLNQNYPNPFNPETNIEFFLKDDSFVSLKVYDVLGKEVETLLNENLNAGAHQIQFNGGNLKSGIYFYLIIAERFRDVKKLMLIK